MAKSWAADEQQVGGCSACAIVARSLPKSTYGQHQTGSPDSWLRSCPSPNFEWNLVLGTLGAKAVKCWTDVKLVLGGEDFKIKSVNN